MVKMTQDEIQAVARAIKSASCPGREGPFGGYDYGHNEAFYGPAPEGGRYVIRDFRDPSSPDWGAWLHQTNDRDEHESMFAKMTDDHVAQAAIAALDAARGDQVARVVEWLRNCLRLLQDQCEPPKLSLQRGATQLIFRLHQQIGDVDADGDWLIVMREVSDTAVIEAMSLSFKLTAKEAEVLYWVVKGKTNKDIGDILGSSPMTVKKHLERVFIKLGVETRTAAAGMAMSKIKQLQPQFNS